MTLIENTEIRMIRAGDIKRHPTHQRKQQNARFSNKMGKFDPVKASLTLIHVVSDGAGGWYALDGANRVEVCCSDADFGPETRLQCRVYLSRNGIPSANELDELFLILNWDRIAPGSNTGFERAVGAGRDDAVVASRLVDLLGPKFRANVCMWNMVTGKGELVASRAVEEALAIWGVDHEVQAGIFTALCEIVEDGNVDKLKRRRKTLSKKEPGEWITIAQMKRLTMQGVRPKVRTCIKKTLLHGKNWS